MKMAYKITEFPVLNERFRSYFGLGFKSFYDSLISRIDGKLQIDIFAFDRWIKRQHGDYEKENKSMNDILLLHYGEKAVELINELS